MDMAAAKRGSQCRAVKSSLNLSALAASVRLLRQQFRNKGVALLALKYPNARFFAQRRFRPHRPQRNALTFILQLQRRACRQTHTVAQRLGKDDAAGAIAAAGAQAPTATRPKFFFSPLTFIPIQCPISPFNAVNHQSIQFVVATPSLMIFWIVGQRAPPAP